MLAVIGLAIGLFLFLMVLAVAVWVAIIVWSWRLAERKGYPGVLGVLLTFVFHLIGLIVLLLLPSRTSVERAFNPPPATPPAPRELPDETAKP